MTLDVSGSDDLGRPRQEEHEDVRIKGRKVSNQQGPINDHDAPCRPRSGGVPSEHEHACMHDECWEPIIYRSSYKQPTMFPAALEHPHRSVNYLQPKLLPKSLFLRTPGVVGLAAEC